MMVVRWPCLKRKNKQEEMLLSFKKKDCGQFIETEIFFYY